MTDLISKAMLSGLGLASLTKDAIEQMAKDLARRSKLSEQEGRRLVKDLQRKSAQAQKAMHQTVESAVHTFAKSLHVATTDDLHNAVKGRGAKTTKKAGRKRSPSKPA